MKAQLDYINNPPVLLRLSEVAAILRVSRSHVYNLISDGVLQATGERGARRVSTRSLCDAFDLTPEDIGAYLGKEMNE